MFDDEDKTEHDNVVARATQLGKELKAAEAAVEEAAEELKRRNAVVNNLKFKRLPELFAEMGGIEEFTINIDGVKYPLQYEEKMSARLSEAKKEEVFAYFKSIGQANMINSNITIPFTKGQAQEKEEFLKYLENYTAHIDIGQVEEIHSSTYTSWCDKNLRDNPSVDLADFGARLVKQVKLGKPKTSKREK